MQIKGKISKLQMKKTSGTTAFTIEISGNLTEEQENVFVSKMLGQHMESIINIEKQPYGTETTVEI